MKTSPHYPRFPYRRAGIRVAGAALALLLVFVGRSGAADGPKVEEKPKAVDKPKVAETSGPADERLADAARYLSSDDLEGRGVGTKGIDKAAEYIARQMAEAGLKTDVGDDGTPLQKFTVTTSARLGPENRLALVGPAAKDGEKARRVELKSGSDFNPMSLSGSGAIDLPLVFVGYGITAKAEGYDDYAGVDVQGKAVLILRHEPQQADPKSVFNGTKHSIYAPFASKLSGAYQHGAAAVVFCSDGYDLERNSAEAKKAWYASLDRLAEESAKFKAIKDPKPEALDAYRKRVDALVRQIQSGSEQLQPGWDPLIPFETMTGMGQARSFPVVYCRRAAVDEMVKAALGTDLDALEKEIDKGPTPHSKALDGWRLEGKIDVVRQEIAVKNVVGVLEGSGPTADETIVLGAHYDHLGYGGHGSLEPKRKAIHNGADDNASGVAVLLEVARHLAAHRPALKRRVVFIAFTGEEMGLLGSGHYVHHPIFPLDKTVAMVNLDMVGRLRDDKLVVMGSGTAPQFEPLLEQINAAYGFKLVPMPGGFGPSDQASFYAQKVPVLHFFTGTHENYHRPSDDFETLNVPGMQRVASLVGDLIVALADAPDAPQYVAIAPKIRSGGNRPYLGTIPDFGRQVEGYAISGVAKGGPAEQAGLRGGDVIVRFGEAKVGGLEDIDGALRQHAAGDRVRTVVIRGKEELTFEITLDPPR